MADLKEGTEDNESDAQLDNSQDFRERDEDGLLNEEGEEARRERAARDQASSSRPRSKVPLLLAVLGLGMAAGWWGHGLQADQVRETGVAVSGNGNEAAGPCRVWADTICERMGGLAYECTHARAASALLSDSACTEAQASVLAKIDAIKVERVECTDLTTKFCADLGPEGKGCELARAKEPTFSIKDCQDMRKNYPRVLAQIVERQEKGTLPNPPRGSRPSLEIATPN